jgi:hypothetical protein
MVHILGIQRKSWKMKKNNMSPSGIEDLLESVSPELIASYERINLRKGENLIVLNEKYKETSRRKISTEEVLRLTHAAIFVFLVIFMVTIFTGLLGSEIYTYILTISVLICGGLIYLIDRRRLRIDKEIIDLETLLNSFRWRCEFLQSPVGRTVRKFTLEVVHDHFVERAVRILDAEQRFENECGRMPRSASNVKSACDWLEKCQADLETNLRGVKLFGLEFVRRELFELAQKELDRQSN